MGSKSRFKLPIHRQGLFGGENLDSLENYAQGLIENKLDVPWLMKISIKPFCLNHEVVTNFETDQRYHSFILKNFKVLPDSYSKCLQQPSYLCSHPLLVNPFSNESDVCPLIANQFLTAGNFKVVEDHHSTQAWYLRDQSCVESLKSSPIDVLTALAESNWDWKSRYETVVAGDTGGFGLGAFAILVVALREAPHVPKALIEKLKAKTLGSDIRRSWELKPDNPEWVKSTVPKVLSAYQRCVETGGIDSERQFAAEIYSAIRESYPKSPAMFATLTNMIESRSAEACVR